MDFRGPTNFVQIVMSEFNIEKILDYPEDKVIILKMVRTLNHITLIKSLLKYLHKKKDKDLPMLVIEFCHRRFTKGYRASVIRLLEKYDCRNYLYDILNLFLKDSYNVSWYSYDVLVKYIARMEYFDLEKFSKLISQHVKKEKCADKKEYHELLLKKINLEIKKRNANS